MKDASNKGRVIIGTAKITIAQGVEIQRRALAGERTTDLAAEFDVSLSAISRIKHNGPPKIGKTLKSV